MRKGLEFCCLLQGLSLCPEVTSLEPPLTVPVFPRMSSWAPGSNTRGLMIQVTADGVAGDDLKIPHGKGHLSGTM